MGAAAGRRRFWVLLVGLGLSLSACSGMSLDDRAGLTCIDDSAECVERRSVTLKSMLADKDRKWVKEPATPQAHASGVRLFAFRSKKAELSCDELALARRDGVLAERRHQLILRALRSGGPAAVTDLSEQLGVSPATIRRDLVKLEEDGLLTRVHGGA